MRHIERARADARVLGESGFDRRTFLKASAAVGAAASVLGVACTGAVAPTGAASKGATDLDIGSDEDFRWKEATIADMQTAMASGEAPTVSRRVALAQPSELDQHL